MAHISYKKLNEVAELIMGQSPPSKTYNDNQDGYKFLQGKADFGHIYPNAKIFCTAPKKISQEYDLLMSVRAPVGDVNISNTTYCIGRGLAAIRANNQELDSKYLYYYLLKAKKQIADLGTGSTFKAISKSILSEIKIPLPPLEVQKKIAAVLDKAQEMIDLREKQISLLDELVQSVFYDMFGDPVRNQKGWELEKVENQIIDIIAGWSVSGEERPKKSNEMGVLKISSVTSGKFNPSECKVVNIDVSGKKIIKPYKGDLLFSRANTRELVAATCIVDNDYEDLFLPDKLWKIEMKSEKLNNYWFKQLLSCSKFRYTLTKQASGTSASMLNISRMKFEKTIIPVPPITLQNEFADKVKKIEAQKARMEASLAKMREVYGSLMQRAFQGKLFG